MRALTSATKGLRQVARAAVPSDPECWEELAVNAIEETMFWDLWKLAHRISWSSLGALVLFVFYEFFFQRAYAVGIVLISVIAVHLWLLRTERYKSALRLTAGEIILVIFTLLGAAMMLLGYFAESPMLLSVNRPTIITVWSILLVSLLAAVWICLKTAQTIDNNSKN